jgi:site-specific recombinase XerD
MVRLGPDKPDAFRKYHELMASDAPRVDMSETVVSLLNAYLNWCEKNRSEQTYTWYRHILSSFARSIGTRLRIDAIKPMHVTRWIENPEWNDTTRSHAVRAIKRVFNWAIKQERLR